MIPALNIIAWSQKAPWAEQRQVEQDLVISRALVELFQDGLLAQELRFRGGTALNKLHFPKPLRYSEDIDFVRTSHGPIGPILDRTRAVLEPWLGSASFGQSQIAPKLLYAFVAEDGTPMRLKIEINTRETDAYAGARAIHHAVENPWFSGAVDVPTFSVEEILATKLRALLQRNKGRDLIDLAHALEVFENLDREAVVSLFQKYLKAGKTPISRAQAEERMFRKLARSGFLSDISPLLAPDATAQLTEEGTRTAFTSVFHAFVALIPGTPWARTAEIAERFKIELKDAS